MSAYRDAELLPVVVIPQGLVRANGSRCTCTPPGWLYRWRNYVTDGDRWYCMHGGGWRWDGKYGSSHSWVPEKESAEK